MADKLNFSLVSPAKELFSGEVDHVIAPGTDGEFGVLVNHAPFMTTLRNGVVSVLDGETITQRIFVRGGFADVTPDGLTILAEEARDLDGLTVEDVQSELDEATTALSALNDDDAAKSIAAEQVDYLEALKSALVH